jgi:hypothetical protein
MRDSDVDLYTFERLRDGKMSRQERREWQQRLCGEDTGLEVVHPDAAGIDIGNASHFVAVPPHRDERPVREFGSWTADLRGMAEWLKRCGIHTVAMQSTGVYWVAVQEILERKRQVILYGPPGTGKTHWADLAAKNIVAHERFDRLAGRLVLDDLDPEERPLRRIHGRLLELARHHLAEALEAADLDPRVRLEVAEILRFASVAMCPFDLLQSGSTHVAGRLPLRQPER